MGGFAIAGVIFPALAVDNKIFLSSGFYPSRISVRSPQILVPRYCQARHGDATNGGIYTQPEIQGLVSQFPKE